VGTNNVRKEKSEKIKLPKNTIHFRTILSAKKPKTNILIPVNKVNVDTRVPKGVVSPPNPK